MDTFKVVVIVNGDEFSVHVTSGGAMPLSAALRHAEAVRRETRAACIALSPAIQKKTGLPEKVYPWDLQKALAAASFYEAVEGRSEWFDRKAQRALRERAEESRHLRQQVLGARCR